MPIKRIKKEDIPAATRNRKSPLKELPEWHDVQAVLAQGLKPAEAVEITLSDRTLDRLKLKNATRLFVNIIQKKLKDLNLQYDVWQQGGKDGKIIYICGR